MVFKIFKLASIQESVSAGDDFVPPQRLRTKAASQPSGLTHRTSSDSLSPQTKAGTGSNASSSYSHNSSPTSSPKQDEEDAFLSGQGSSGQLDGVDYLLNRMSCSSNVPPSTTNIHTNNVIMNGATTQNNFLTVSSEETTKGLSQTPVNAHSRKRLPSGSLIRPYHHYKVFYCGDNRYNLLHDIAVDQFVLSKSTRMYKIGKSAPIDRLNLSSMSVTKQRSNISMISAESYNQRENSCFLKAPEINLSLNNDEDCILQNVNPVPSNRNNFDEFNDIQQANSFSVSSSLIETAHRVPTSIGQQLYNPPSGLNSSFSNNDTSFSNQLYNSNDEPSSLDIIITPGETEKTPVTTQPESLPNAPYYRSSVNLNYLSPFLPPNNNNNMNNQQKNFGSSATIESKSSSSSSSSSLTGRSHNTSFFGSATSFAEGIETTVIHPIDITRFLPTQSHATQIPTTSKITSKHDFVNNYAHITDEIVFVAAGFDNTFFLSQSGRIWSCGENSCQQLGHPGNDLAEIPDAQFLHIKEIISRGEHTLFLAHDNISLYTCGSNRFGQCGIGSPDQEITKLTKVSKQVGPIQQVVCGYDHTVILTFDHQVYMCGDNSDFQLGNSFPPTVNELTKLDTSRFTKSRIVKVQAGDYHTMLLTANGEVFVTGSNNYGEIGSGGPVENFTLLKEIIHRFNANICDIYSNSLTSYLRDVNGSFYVMGDNQYGHAAVGYAMDIIPPTRSEILSDPNILDIYVGKCHLVYTKKSKRSPQEVEVYSIGLNEFNQLGIESEGPDDHHTVPVRLLDLETIYQYQRKRWRTKRMNIVCSTYSTVVYFTTRNENEVSELFKLLMLRLVCPEKWEVASAGKKLEMGFDVDLNDNIWKFDDIAIVTQSN